jgi:D-3-phosphoglycerate dehydrogenase / 2-oxoglutarate reductase
MSASYRILVTDDIDRDGIDVLTSETAFQVDTVPTLPSAELLERISNYDALIGRSATRISRELLRRGTRLRVIGRAGVGVDNIALETATELGVAVINAPAGNTVAVAELLFGGLLSLLRHLPLADSSMHAGRWERSKLLGNELRGRTLGIVGLGRIGGEVAKRARAFGVTVIGYDPYVGDERFDTLHVRRAASLADLLTVSNIITVHTPLNAETRGMIGRREIAQLPSGTIVANLARGGIVDESALLDALTDGTLFGAVIDVYTAEPLAADHPLRTATNVVLTPHIGASTAEAQRNVAVDVCVAVRDALLSGELSRSVNVASVNGMRWEELQPALFVARRAGAIARALLTDREVRVLSRLTLRCGSSLAGGSGAILAAAAMGALEGVLDVDRLNLINARTLAEAHGLELMLAESSQLDHPSALEVGLGGGVQGIVVAGVAAPGTPPRITRIGDFRVDIAPRRSLVVLTNHDVPGVIGRVGTVLGTVGVNIAEYHQARLLQGGEALAAISVDSEVNEDLRRTLLDLPDVTSATIVHFREA